MKVNKLLIIIGTGFTAFCLVSQLIHPKESIWEPISFAGGAWVIIGGILIWNKKHGVK